MPTEREVIQSIRDVLERWNNEPYGDVDSLIEIQDLIHRLDGDTSERNSPAGWSSETEFEDYHTGPRMGDMGDPPVDSSFDQDDDDDPQCVCGVYRSEHALCGCPEGFQTAKQWQSEREFIIGLDDDEYERIYGGD